VVGWRVNENQYAQHRATIKDTAKIFFCCRLLRIFQQLSDSTTFAGVDSPSLFPKKSLLL
jgi:hypothetical protein